MTESIDSSVDVEARQSQLSLSTAAARNLTTTTKTVPQMEGISSRWLLKLLPWVQVSGGTYRVNRRLRYSLGDGRVEFISTGAEVRVIPAELCELPPLQGFGDPEVLETLAGKFVQQEYEPGDVLVEAGTPADQLFLIAHGKANKIGTGKYGDPSVLAILTDGGYFGDQVLTGTADEWEYTVKAVTACTVLVLSKQAFTRLINQSDDLQDHIQRVQSSEELPSNHHGEASIELASGHDGEPELPGTFADYESSPREYQLSVAQTVLRVHTRVADLYNDPMNQVEQQLRLTIEAIRERQDHELINNPDFGLLYNADLKQRISTRTGPPTPDDLDDLLATVWKEPTAFLAHPLTIAAFGRECSKQGVYPQHADFGGRLVRAWRGIPIFPCSKIPISDTQTTSMLLMRTGEHNQGVVGLHQTGIPDEYQPSLSVRFMGINDKAVINYLVSAYYSAAVLVPDALGILENVEISRRD